MDNINEYKKNHVKALAAMSEVTGVKLIVETSNGTINGFYEELPYELPDNLSELDLSSNNPDAATLAWRIAMAEMFKNLKSELDDDASISHQAFLMRDAKLFNGLNSEGLSCSLILVFFDQIVGLSIGQLSKD